MTAAWSGLPTLSPIHQAELQASGITPEVASQHGIITITYPKDIAQCLGWKSVSRASALGSCLKLPYYDIRGNWTSYCRLKPEYPLVNDSGKPSKYLGPRGIPVGVYFPRQHVEAYQSVDIPLIKTEGEKKALCGALHGFATIGLGGVTCWSAKRLKDANGHWIGHRELNTLLTPIPLLRRRVYIAFDSDRTIKPDVLREEWLLSQALIRAGADVRILMIPHGSYGKQGLDDYLVANGRDALLELMDKATEPVKPGTRQVTSAGDKFTNPHRLVEQFLNKYYRTPKGDRTLHWWQEGFVHYQDGGYQFLPTDSVQNQLIRYLRQEFLYQAKLSGSMSQDVRCSLIQNTQKVLQSECSISHDVEPPCWLDPTHTNPKATNLAFRNGILSLNAGELTLSPPSPLHFTFNRLPFDYDTQSPLPREWLEFLHSIWPDDPQSIEALQEWFGYLLTSDTEQQKILFLLGPRRSGKGTILRVLTELVGSHNTCSPSLASLGTRFGKEVLIQKTVAILNDIRLSSHADRTAIVESLLGISGEDKQTIDRKHRRPVTVRLPPPIGRASRLSLLGWLREASSLETVEG